ncbi:glycosyl hydrolase [Paenibacillus sp. Marseille-Q4541]|uniref:glycosyl hydrolase n=1 Tax=Paenibacillus sp. Marseille-Q4541 TaxID=2831522 RepID=UPI001BA9159F|nr:glycosyl hydrolase [Paenibacillus sp. Marseille-Q4541]
MQKRIAIDHNRLMEQFLSPEAVYRPQPFWFLNHTLNKQELKEQIQAMHEEGVGGVVLHARHGLQTSYLSTEFMEVLEFCTQECHKRNMVVWLYDEENWPSGTLGGQLTRQYPEYRMRYMRMEERRYIPGMQQGALHLDYSSYDNNELIAILAYRAIQQGEEWLLCGEAQDISNMLGEEWKPDTNEPYIILACWSCEIAEGITFKNGYYLDTLNPEAVQAFIRMSYEPFLQLQEHFGTTIQGVFTDEPGLMIHDGFFGTEAIRTEVHNVNATLPGVVLPWTRDMEKRFQQENGYHLVPRLGALLYNMADSSRTTRQQYYDTISRWYVDGYHAAIRSWCERQRLLYIGHTLEEPVWGQARSQGNQTRVLQQFHYAGVDYLTPGIGTKENPYRIVSVKTAASVAQLEKKERVICESFGASGHAYSMRQRRLDANFMAFLGVNLFIPHAFYYSFAGYRKTDFPPTEFKHAPHWNHYRTFADYIARLSLLGTHGKRSPEVLLLSPIHTVYQDMFVSGQANVHPLSDVLFSRLSDRMLRCSVDYDYVDECQLREAQITQGEGFIFREGQPGYPIIIMPEIQVLSKDIAAKLITFVNSGGTLIALNRIPMDSEVRRQDPELAKYMETLFGDKQEHGEQNSVGKGYSLFYDLNELTDEAATRESLEIFCGDLKGMLRNHASLSWSMMEGQIEDLIMVERQVEDQHFVWLMNWSEQTVKIRIDKDTNRDNSQEWCLESGSIQPLPQNGVISFAAGELRIIAVSPAKNTITPTEKDKEGKFFTQDEILLDDKWQFKTKDPNVLLLDEWQVTLNDRQSRMNAIMPGQVNTYRTKFIITEALKHQLYSSKDTGDSVQGDLGKIELILDEVEQKIPAHIGFLQRRRNIEIFVNGVRQQALLPSRWQDNYYQSVNITSHLEIGENELEILMVSLLEPMPAISFPAYLIGPFAVHDRTLTTEQARVSGDASTAGYPYYSGVICYTQQIDVGQLDISVNEEWWLEAEDIRETVRLFVNDKDAGVKLWPPYRWDISPYVEQGKNKVTLQIANTLENLYGKTPLPSGITGQVKIVRRLIDKTFG